MCSWAFQGASYTTAQLPIFSVRESCIVKVLLYKDTMTDFFITAIANIRSFIEAGTTFPLKIWAGRAGGTFDPAENVFPANIYLFAVISTNTEVMYIIESALVIPVRGMVAPDFFRNRCKIFTQKTGNIFK